MDYIVPGVYFNEKDQSINTDSTEGNVSILIGETEFGPAFKPTVIKSWDDFYKIFGKTNKNYPLTYAAFSFLKQSNNLQVIRVLGDYGDPTFLGGFLNKKGLYIYIEKTGTPSQYYLLGILRILDNNYNFVDLGPNNGKYIEYISSGNYQGLFHIRIEDNNSTSFDIYFKFDQNSPYFIGNVIEKNIDNIVYLEEFYPSFWVDFNESTENANIFARLINANEDYKSTFKNARTPIFLSENLKPLFRVHSLSDGDNSNYRIKISITNINFKNKTFDLLVRDINSPDDYGFTDVLERYTKLSTIESMPNFVGKVIGTKDGRYVQRSKYITIETLIEDEGGLPVGHEGYNCKSFQIDQNTYTITNIKYKTSYSSSDTISKTFLGLTEKYWGNNNIVNKILLSKDLFSYHGNENLGKTKGFLIINIPNASTQNFEIVNYNYNPTTKQVTEIVNGTPQIVDILKLKYNVYLEGGFDGFNKYQKYNEYYQKYNDYDPNSILPENVQLKYNVSSFLKAIELLKNEEQLKADYVALPGINFKNNSYITNEVIKIIEERQDMIYVLDPPRSVSIINNVKIPEIGTLVNDIQVYNADTSRAAVYYPYIIAEDPYTKELVVIPPSALVLQTYAYTDSVFEAWASPAGINKIVNNEIIKTLDITLSKKDQELLYYNNINPIVIFTGYGITVWGQKTLLTADSYLNRINIRKLVNYVRKNVNQLIKPFVFEPNNEMLKDRFINKVEPFMLQIKNLGGIYDYKIIVKTPQENPEYYDKHIFKAIIKVKPTKDVEYFDIDFELIPFTEQI